jgi:5-methylcytosine-specific restriction endonuclease McrA
LATDTERTFAYTYGVPRNIYDWSAIQRYHDEGHGFVECQKRFGFCHTAWVKAVRSGRLKTGRTDFSDRRRRYDWAEIQAYYDEGHTYKECMARFGFCAAAWHKARQRGEIKPRHLVTPIDQLLRTSHSRHAVKRRLLQAGLLENRCETCGISEWLGRPLAIHIDHINGICDDHRLENLRMLCPNCHSQTDTYGAKNRRKLKPLQDRHPAV